MEEKIVTLPRTERKMLLAQLARDAEESAAAQAEAEARGERLAADDCVNQTTVEGNVP